MTTDGHVLELLHGAWDRFQTLEATLRTRTDMELQREVMERWASVQPGGRGIRVYGHHRPGMPPPPRVEESTVNLWVQKPSRWRGETERSGHAGTQVTGGDGTTWWLYDPRQGAVHGEETGGQGGILSRMDRDLQLAIDPAPIIPHLYLQVQGQTVHAGREAILVAAQPRGEWRPQRGMPVLPIGADRYELSVDAERGILLRVASYIEGQEFNLTEIVSVAFDRSLPADLFVFNPPSGMKVREIPRPSDRSVRSTAVLRRSRILGRLLRGLLRRGWL